MNCPKCDSQRVQRLKQHSFCMDCEWDDMPEIDESGLTRSKNRSDLILARQALIPPVAPDVSE